MNDTKISVREYFSILGILGFLSQYPKVLGYLRLRGPKTLRRLRYYLHTVGIVSGKVEVVLHRENETSERIYESARL